MPIVQLWHADFVVFRVCAAVYLFSSPEHAVRGTLDLPVQLGPCTATHLCLSMTAFVDGPALEQCSDH